MAEENTFKENKWCGFRQGGKCTDSCGLFCEGLKGCVLHGINMQIRELVRVLSKGTTKKEKTNPAYSS